VSKVHPAVAAAARLWPLTVTQDLGERAAPDGTKKTGWQFHARCARGGCGQSVFCAGNDSGSFTWTLYGELEPAITAHLFQCHRADLGLDQEATS
jgi:hypothetical protein